MNTHLTDMARSVEETKDVSPMAAEPDKYPYGLRICLNQDDLEKLDTDMDNFEIDGVYHIHALVKVVGKNMTQSQGDEERGSVSLQITHLAPMENEDAEGMEEESDEPDLSKHGYLRYGK